MWLHEISYSRYQNPNRQTDGPADRRTDKLFKSRAFTSGFAKFLTHEISLKEGIILQTLSPLPEQFGTFFRM